MIGITGVGITINSNGEIDRAVKRGEKIYKKRTGQTANCIALPQTMKEITVVRELPVINHRAQTGHVLVGKETTENETA